MAKFARGRKKTAGRKKGTPNKATAKKAKEVEESGLTPLDYMLSVMRAPMPAELEGRLDENDIEVLSALTAWHAKRLEAAKAAAPYIHPRLANIEHTGKDGGPIKTEEVDPMAAARRIAFLLSMGAARAT